MKRWNFLCLLVLPLFGFLVGCDNLTSYLFLSSPGIISALVSLLGIGTQAISRVAGVGVILLATMLPMGCAAERAHLSQVVAYAAAGADDAGWDCMVLGNLDLTNSLLAGPFGISDASKSTLIIKMTKVRDAKNPGDMVCPWLTQPESYLKAKGVEQLGRDGTYLAVAMDDLGYTGSVSITVDPSGSIIWYPFGITVVNKGSISMDIHRVSGGKSKTPDKVLCPWFKNPTEYENAYQPVVQPSTQPVK